MVSFLNKNLSYHLNIGGRFDQHFIVRELYAQNRVPNLIMTGNKIYEMRIKKRSCANLVFRDSYMLLLAPLDALKDTFNLKCDNKMFFPHLFNKKSNMNVKLEHLPPMEDYCPNTMKDKKLEQFRKWYNTNKNTPFNLFDSLRE